MDILRLIFIIAILGLYVYDFIKFLNEANKSTRDKAQKIGILVLICLLFVLFIVSFALKFKYLHKSDTYFFSDFLVSYTDSYKISRMYRYIHFLESIFLIVLIIKALSFCQLISLATLLFSSIGNTLLMFFQFLIVLLCCLFALSSIAEIVWGPYLDEFKTFGLSFISILLFTSSYYNSSKILEYDVFWGILFVVIIFIIQMLIFITFFASIFAESLRRSVCTYGYPQDYESTQWDLNDYKVWLFHFINNSKEKKEEPQN